MYFDDLENKDEAFWKRVETVLTVPEHEEYLGKMTEHVDLELGEKIAAKLIATLSYLNRKKRVALGLAANQIGINKSVFVINVDNPMYFINPDVVELSNEKTKHEEGCLSVPKKSAIISRHLKIKIKADNLTEPVWYGIEWDGGQIDEIKFLESMTIQHEFNHLHGLLITDLDEKPLPIIAEKKPGRNELVEIVKDDIKKKIKYKKIEQYQKDGWELV